MPGLINGTDGARKRKRSEETPSKPRNKRRTVVDSPSQKDDIETHLLELETQISESRRYYNNIVTLLVYLRDDSSEDRTDLAAAVALCRVFCRLLAAGSLTKSRDAPENEVTIVEWLKSRFQEYTEALLDTVVKEDSFKQSTSLTLLMRLVKESAVYLKPGEDSTWRHGLFTEVLRRLLEAESGDMIRAEFVEKYVEEYDDVRFYTFAALASLTPGVLTASGIDNMLSILTAVENVPESKDELEDFYIGPPPSPKHRLYSLTAHKKEAQEAWLKLLRQDINKAQRKKVLELMSHRIAPWFLKIELLMDFLTDSFNLGGSTALLALSGLFYLIREKNLDYPHFYQKLYSLLDSDILHSKHRSRFFRLLDTFLASTHLPAALVASFIKRLSRLSLYAPPSAIVVLVPWFYNLLRNHPTCTFMIHRETCDETEKARLKAEGMLDPFAMEEQDPMKTNAINSSLWEIEALQSHYHPNVATIAKIISQQFTKQAYNLEDFLDHSYGSMLDAELAKDVKKAPVVEFDIPKRIFLTQEADSLQPDSLLVQMWDFS
ncbi:Nucleolar complex protein 4 [Lasallia pustulata]|uniref:Nucleolar complex protein 4 n=1 Tax=Lasallia pustulata TaxID=136370 RepID=A0A1W5DC63_9LECA|nr:Nucleolar complex protein 4 [Lasallia pustulata]